MILSLLNGIQRTWNSMYEDIEWWTPALSRMSLHIYFRCLFLYKNNYKMFNSIVTHFLSQTLILYKNTYKWFFSIIYVYMYVLNVSSFSFFVSIQSSYKRFLSTDISFEFQTSLFINQSSKFCTFCNKKQHLVDLYQCVAVV